LYYVVLVLEVSKGKLYIFREYNIYIFSGIDSFHSHSRSRYKKHVHEMRTMSSLMYADQAIKRNTIKTKIRNMTYSSDVILVN